MKTLKIAAVAALLVWAIASTVPAKAQTVGYNVRTGDVWVDTRLGEINDYGRRYHDPFVSEMTGHYGAPRSLVLDLLDRRGWAPADVYFACAIARALGIPCLDVVNRYERNPGQGWGNLAKQMGIKPGSPAFHALKNGAVGTYDRWGYPIRIDQRVSVDWAQHGPGRGKSSSPGQGGKPDHAGHAGKGNGNKGNGKGNNGKANGRD
ncbi:hypothetical protein [Pseudoxanthomonas sp. PXM02]|uniref:hypothetical protein n=1 Tax=Pseudoxanthomonas sp. PXM02 TaxID=2769294 RepID=UPI00178361BC|nr:hypothetical protein [Pseudoxanthomonas sp. PXM02]MBD9481103.1 hypothetical protein [Pseudoxanthomonas sp. PXM02]